MKNLYRNSFYEILNCSFLSIHLLLNKIKIKKKIIRVLRLGWISSIICSFQIGFHHFNFFVCFVKTSLWLFGYELRFFNGLFQLSYALIVRKSATLKWLANTFVLFIYLYVKIFLNKVREMQNVSIVFKSNFDYN